LSESFSGDGGAQARDSECNRSPGEKRMLRFYFRLKASIPVLRSQIRTPALLVDMTAMESNLKKMAAFFAEGPTKLRPHL
jgi:hypothetical protein